MMFGHANVVVDCVIGPVIDRFFFSLLLRTCNLKIIKVCANMGQFRTDVRVRWTLFFVYPKAEVSIGVLLDGRQPSLLHNRS
jgi:hypothetical protein